MFVFRHLSLGAVLLAIACSLSQAQDPNAGDPVIAEARKAAAVFVDSLPKYLVKRTTTRSENTRLVSADSSGCSSSAARANPSACQGDHGKEIDMSIRVNGALATEQQVDKSGSWAEYKSARPRL
jgi:hypothetical protein